MHISLLGHCPNEEILRALNRTHLLFGPTRYLFDPFPGISITLIEAARSEHLRIVAELLAGQMDLAAQSLRVHFEDAVERWLKRLEITPRMSPMQFPSYLGPI